MTEYKKPIYGVFIIESMDFENENDGNLDGWTLKTILDLCHIKNQYYYIRTKKELENLIEIFDESDYAFLHIACHGSEKALHLTYDIIEFYELEQIIGESLYHRRLFLSACKAASFELAEYFIPKHHCLSVIGSPNDIDYDKAAVFWSSFYYLMYDIDKVSMPQKHLMPILENVSSFYKLKLNYFSIIGMNSPKSIGHLREFNYDSGKKIYNEVKLTRFRNKNR